MTYEAMTLQSQRPYLFMCCSPIDSQDENRKQAQSLASETEAMKEALASQDSSSNRRMLQRYKGGGDTLGDCGISCIRISANALLWNTWHNCIERKKNSRLLE